MHHVFLGYGRIKSIYFKLNDIDPERRFVNPFGEFSTVCASAVNALPNTGTYKAPKAPDKSVCKRVPLHTESSFQFLFGLG